jgi:phosphate uptake regulator
LNSIEDNGRRFDLAKVVEKRNEEQRKLQVTGGSTYILSLPKEWVTRNQLKKGSLMVLSEEDDGSLSITSSRFEKERKDEAFIRVSSNDNPDAVMRKAISAYLIGYNIFHVRTQGQQPLAVGLRNYLKHFARNYLVGAEIVIDSPTDLTLQILLNYSELSVQSALRRMSIIASSMHREAVGCLESLDYSAAKAVVETDREVNRFSLYIVRLLKLAVSNARIVREIGLDNSRECLGYRLIVKSVERTADHATKIAENVLFLKNPVNPELLERIKKLSSLAISMFESAVEALFRHDYYLAESIIEEIAQIYKLEKDAVLSSHAVKIEEIPNLRLLIESIRRTAEYASDISEVVLNLNVEAVLT